MNAWALTDVITRLRRVLRVAIRSEHPWETLPMAQVEILQRLNEHSRVRVRDLADQQRLAANTVSTLLQQMVAAEFVEREPDPDDGRAIAVSITGKGEQALASWLAGNQRRLESGLQMLAGRDRLAIANAMPALSRLAAALEDQQLNNGPDDPHDPAG